MEVWQIVAFAFVALLPFALMVDFWPHRERLTYNGRPAAREWQRQVTHTPADDDHH